MSDSFLTQWGTRALDEEQTTTIYGTGDPAELQARRAVAADCRLTLVTRRVTAWEDA